MSKENTMNEHESKVWRFGIFMIFLLLCVVFVFANVVSKRDHEEKLKMVESENTHPGIWRK